MDSKAKFELELQYCKRHVHVIIKDEFNPFEGDGVVTSVDDAGQLHGTWSGLAAIPGVDTIDIIPSVVTSVIKTELSIDNTMFVATTDGQIYKISEGTGDNLLPDDVNDGYVDYIYYDKYESLAGFNEDSAIVDGGMILLKKFYKEHTVEEILKIVEDYDDVKFVVEKDK